MIHRLGITQHLIRSGIARLEEVRDANDKLENLYIRVSGSSPILSDYSLLSNNTGRQEACLDQGTRSNWKALDRVTSAEEHSRWSRGP